MNIVKKLKQIVTFFSRTYLYFFMDIAALKLIAQLYFDKFFSFSFF
jgi:hypothetical protein